MGLYVGGGGPVCVCELINLRCVLLGVGYQESRGGILWWWLGQAKEFLGIRCGGKKKN